MSYLAWQVYSNGPLYDLHPDLLDACSTNGIDYSDIERVISYINGRNDYEDWHWICLIRPKEMGMLYTFAYITGGCDYTGWNCQSNAERFDSDSIDELFKYVGDDYKTELKKGLWN